MTTSFEEELRHLHIAYVSAAHLTPDKWKRTGTCDGCGDRASMADLSLRQDGSMYRCVQCAAGVFEARKE